MKRVIVMVCAVLVLGCAAYAADTLVYDGGGSGGIQQAMVELGIAYDLRTAATPVTAADLASHNLLVVGWNELGDMSGLSAPVLAGGITGIKLLTGHDADWHVVHGQDAGGGGDAVDAAATLFLSQAIGFAGGGGGGGGCGLVALADFSTGFSYLPPEWCVAQGGLIQEYVSAITPQGQASGVYDGLTAADMSNWINSYHASFIVFAPEFAPFELGNYGEPITIATPEPATLCLLGVGAAGMFLRRRRK